MNDIKVTFQTDKEAAPSDPYEAFELWWKGFTATDFFSETNDEESKQAVKAACFGSFVSALDYSNAIPPARARRFVDHVVFTQSQGKN